MHSEQQQKGDSFIVRDEFHLPRSTVSNNNKVYCYASAVLSPTAFSGIFGGKSACVFLPLRQTSKCPLSLGLTCQASRIFRPPSLLSCLPNLILECFGHEVKKDSPIYHNLPSTTGSQSQPQSYRLTNPASAQA